MTGDARLTHITAGPARLQRQTLAGHGVSLGALAEAPGQLLWGRLPSGASEEINGQPLSTWAGATASQTAVSLPTFAPGSIQYTDTATLAAIARDLRVRATSPGGISITVDAGNVDPLDTVVRAIPPTTDPYHLYWISSTSIAPAYALKDENAQRVLDNYSFALAIVLGAAGAGLLASVQTIIHVRTATKD
jgi:hypothetical protein